MESNKHRENKPRERFLSELENKYDWLMILIHDYIKRCSLDTFDANKSFSNIIHELNELALLIAKYVYRNSKFDHNDILQYLLGYKSKVDILNLKYYLLENPECRLNGLLLALDSEFFFERIRWIKELSLTVQEWNKCRQSSQRILALTPSQKNQTVFEWRQVNLITCYDIHSNFNTNKLALTQAIRSTIKTIIDKFLG